MTDPRGKAASSALLLLCLTLAAGPARPSEEARPRARDLGLKPGILPPGPLNAITDVAGVRVGHRTLIRGDRVRTGVTAILPHGGNLFRRKVPAAVHVGNGFGKAAGFLQVEELGQLETPIVLTDTLGVGTAVRAVVSWTLAQAGNEDVLSVNAVVGETNDGQLNDIRGFHVTEQDVRSAIQSARAGPLEEGSVGAGTGTVAFGWKGGIGTSSRKLPPSLGGYTIGALVQTNFGGILTMDGLPVGEILGRYPFREALENGGHPGGGAAGDGDGGSCMIVLATDAPLSSRSLHRLATRSILALGRVGSFMSNGSGDFVIAFSTANIETGDGAPTRTVVELREARMDPLFLAAVEAVEEAIYDSLLRATTVTGYRGRTVEAIPVERLRKILRDAAAVRGERGRSRSTGSAPR